MKKVRSLRVFISHASADKRFALLVADALRSGAISPWIDKEQVLVGDDVLEKLGEGLGTMDLLLFIVSKKALESRWVDRELKFAARREIEEKKILILPFIIDSTLSNKLPWYLHHLRSERVSADENGVAAILSLVKNRATQRLRTTNRRSQSPTKTRESQIDKIIAGVGLGDWKKATAAALRILQDTDAAGDNQTFEKLLTYQDLSDDDAMLWPALNTIVMCCELAPGLLNRLALFRMAIHSNFSVRSSAAFICMSWAQFAPDRVPVDIVLKLSVYDEDWYVQAPANAALKSMASAVPGVLSIFYSRLGSSDAQERDHAAICISDIADKEPNILDKEDLRQALADLKTLGDPRAIKRVERSLARVGPGEMRSRYKYGL